ncbi:hypothetical protein HanIR_Chr04g0181361 [Helianthus annuus]|nr:hypothetical protein HanIR_Chr04g0181361 [Helianthus annuus]
MKFQTTMFYRLPKKNCHHSRRSKEPQPPLNRFEPPDFRRLRHRGKTPPLNRCEPRRR